MKRNEPARNHARPGGKFQVYPARVAEATNCDLIVTTTSTEPVILYVALSSH